MASKKKSKKAKSSKDFTWEDISFPVAKVDLNFIGMTEDGSSAAEFQIGATTGHFPDGTKVECTGAVTGGAWVNISTDEGGCISFRVGAQALIESAYEVWEKLGKPQSSEEMQRLLEDKVLEKLSKGGD